MRRHLERYVIEIVLILLGAVGASVESIVTNHTDTALILGLTSLLLALAVAAIRQEIERQIGDALLDRHILNAIPDPRWRREAEDEIEQARVRFNSWGGGTRRVDERSSLNYQIESLRTATMSVSAVHLAMEPDSLQMWADRQRGFDRLVEAYRNLPEQVERRRILVLDRDDKTVSRVVDGRRLIVDNLTEEVCRVHVTARAQGGLGFNLRIRWARTGNRDVSDLLIVDGREACSIESFGHDHFGDLEVSVNGAIVGAYVRRFEDLWTDATPVERCLPDQSSHTDPPAEM